MTTTTTTTTTATMKYKCFSSDFDRVQKRIAHITKKLDKHNINYKFEVGLTAIEKVKVYDIIDTAQGKRNRFLGYQACEVQYYNFDMGTLKLGNFEVTAVLDHSEFALQEINVIHTIKEGFQVPTKYRTAKSICEHCNSD
jgi:hypothetical protein